MALGGISAGAAFVEVLPNAAGFGANLDRQITPQLTKTQARLSQFKAVAGVAFVAAGAAALKFAASSVEAYRQSEVATVALQNAISKSPALLGETTAAFQEQATALQNLTGVQDEEILAADTILARFKLTGDQIREVTPLVLDYAQASGKDVPAAADAVGKALLGNTRALKEIGINYKLTGDSATDLANIQDLLKEKVGGAAEAFGGTNAGKMAIFSAKLDDLKETIGKALIPILDGLVKGLTFLVDIFQSLPGPVKSVAITVGILGTAFVALGIALNVVRGALRGYTGDVAGAVIKTEALAVAEGETAVATTGLGVAAGTAGGIFVIAATGALAFAGALKMANDEANKQFAAMDKDIGTVKEFGTATEAGTKAQEDFGARLKSNFGRLGGFNATAAEYRSRMDAATAATKGLSYAQIQSAQAVSAAQDRMAAYATTINRVTGAETQATQHAVALKRVVDAFHDETFTYTFNFVKHQLPGAPGPPPIVRAGGGPITEHVIGIGQRTGRTWEFGERGVEDVVPRSGGRSHGGGGLSADDLVRALWPVLRALASHQHPIQIGRREIALAVSDQGLAER